MEEKILTTGIGSVPFLDCKATCGKILETFPLMPFWPQMVRLGPKERMLNQFLEGLNFLRMDENGDLKIVKKIERESALAEFYEHVISEDLAHFAISEESAVGLYELVRFLVAKGDNISSGFVKGQVVGPFTLAISATDEEGIAAVNDPDIFEAILVAIEKKAVWQIDFLSRTLRKVVLFLDEPSLSGYGSAFSTINADKLVGSITQLISNIEQNRDVLIGIHCCGNTDWGLLLRTGIDIISLDSYGFSENFFLYPKEIKHFIEKGGMIAWGLVPTSDAINKIDLNLLKNAIRSYIDYWEGLGFEAKYFWEKSIFTPSCGMGSLNDKEASMVFEFMSGLQNLISL
jgi:hypothetical protein